MKRSFSSPQRVSFLLLSVILLSLTAIAYKFHQDHPLKTASQAYLRTSPPLVMQGGDPYIRALMRTITASESNVRQPYHVLYGGQYVTDLKKHPEQCIPIRIGPNTGNCSTAAGRYQFINTTWFEKAERYHPKSSQFLWWKSYSFEPEYQDAVVYAWLNDPTAWGVNIGQKLRQGEVKEVLRLLSPTWTSLGYGIETNSMSDHLPQIYQQMLHQELGNTT